MLTFKQKNDTKAQIIFDIDNRRDFDILRDYFKTENQAVRFVKNPSFSMNPFIYAITPLGQYDIGMTQEICDQCDRMKIEYEVDDALIEVVSPSLSLGEILPVPNQTYKYRDYQERLIRSLADNGRGVIISPTRSGKSLVIAGLIHNIFSNVEDFRIQNILIIVPNIQLVFQFQDDLIEYGLNKDYNIQAFTAKTMCKKDAHVIIDKLNIYIANTQYLLLHGDELPFTDMVFCDEVHQCKKSSEISKLLKSMKINHKFGCTGTLPSQIMDKWMISGIFGPVLDEVEIKKLQDEKILADVKIFPIRFKHSRKENFRIPELDENGNPEDAFTTAQKAFKKESIYLDTFPKTNKMTLAIAKKLVEEHPDWNVLMLFDYTAHGEQMFKMLKYDKKHYVDGSIDIKIRRDVVNQMNETGGHILIAQSKTFSTGITISRLNAIFLVNSGKSATKIIQSIGRGLRRQNKTAILVFDISHDYPYSQKHFDERTELYKKFYDLIIGRDYSMKLVPITVD